MPLVIHPLGALIAFGFVLSMILLMSWMLWVPKPVAQTVARARRSVGGVRRILVPLEGGVTSDRAVELACRLGREQHADIYLAYIIEIPRTRALNTPLHEGESGQARQTLRFAEQIVKLNRLRAVTMVERAREVSEGILRLSNEVQPDLLVIGMPSLYSTVRGLAGTLAMENILRRASCEVLVSKMPG
jgi:nucleotide-binding universal stress UspA family protein